VEQSELDDLRRLAAEHGVTVAPLLHAGAQR
jgi:hypothetical protein